MELNRYNLDTIKSTNILCRIGECNIKSIENCEWCSKNTKNPKKIFINTDPNRSPWRGGLIYNGIE